MGDQGRVGHPQEDLPWNLFNWEKGGRFYINSQNMLHCGSLLRTPGDWGSGAGGSLSDFNGPTLWDSLGLRAVGLLHLKCCDLG